MTIGTPSYKGYKFHKIPGFIRERAWLSHEMAPVLPRRVEPFMDFQSYRFFTNLDETQQKKNLIF